VVEREVRVHHRSVVLKIQRARERGGTLFSLACVVFFQFEA
jgi:hypothetical protein